VCSYELDSTALQQGCLVGYCERDREPLCCVKGEVLHDHLSNYQLLQDYIYLFNLPYSFRQHNLQVFEFTATCFDLHKLSFRRAYERLNDDLCKSKHVAVN